MFADLFRIGLGIRFLGEFALPVESEPQPVRIRLEFRAVTAGELRQIEFRMVPVVVERVERELRAETFMGAFQSGEVETVEDRGEGMTVDVIEEEHVVVDEEIVHFPFGQSFEHRNLLS